MDRRLPLLFSLAALPACKDGKIADDPRTPGGGDPADFVQTCVAFYNGYIGCYQDLYGSSGSYSYGSTGTREDYAMMLCEESRDDLSEEYGQECVGVLEEIYACINSLDCEALVVGFENWPPEECRAVYVSASERCPDAVSYCATASVGLEANGCEVSAEECLDGRAYEIRCDETSPDATTCDCLIDGEVTETVALEGDEDCFDEGVLDRLGEACSFPGGVF